MYIKISMFEILCLDKACTAVWSVKLFPVFLFLGFISTKPFEKLVQSADSPMYAVDCEMVCFQINNIKFQMLFLPFDSISSLHI